MVVGMRRPLEPVQFHRESIEVEAIARPGKQLRGSRKRAVRQVHRIPRLRARDDLEVDCAASGSLDVLCNIADVIRVVVRIHGGSHRLVSHRPNGLSDVVVDALKRVEDEHAALADMEDRAVVECLDPPRSLRETL
jgi:hypothetical protein